MEFHQTEIDNGLTIVAEVNPAAASMAAGFFVRTGSRDETEDIAGVSHFLEHMVFKGTDRRSALQVNIDFDEMGADYNAFTSEENTVFYGAVLPEFQTRLLDLLGDLLRPSLRQADFDVEKNVILDEIARYMDQPRFRVYESLMTEHFAPHPLGHSILGTPKSIGALKRDQMLEYFQRRYSPGNITVVGTGNIDFAAFTDKVAQMCGRWQAHDVSRKTSPASPAANLKVVQDTKVLREHIGLMSAAPSRQDEHRYAAELLSAIVGDATGSRLYYALVEPAIADEAGMSFSPMDGEGAFFTFVAADAPRATEALGIVRRELDKFADEGPTEQELQAAKNKIASHATLRGELPMGRLAAVGFDWTYRGLYTPLPEEIEKLFAVGRQDVLELARKCRLTQATVYALGPLERL